MLPFPPVDAPVPAEAFTLLFRHPDHVFQFAASAGLRRLFRNKLFTNNAKDESK
jgi:hypothetical protein